MFTLTCHSAEQPLPLTWRDRHELQEIFKNFDIEQISQLEPLVHTIVVPTLDPLEEMAWIACSSGSETELDEVTAILA